MTPTGGAPQGFRGVDKAQELHGTFASGAGAVPLHFGVGVVAGNALVVEVAVHGRWLRWNACMASGERTISGYA